MIENMTDDSIYEVYRRAVAHFPSGSVFVEVGCYYGKSVIYLAEEINRVGKNIKVFAVDTFDYKEGVEGKVDIYPDFLDNITAYIDIIYPVKAKSLEAVELFKGDAELVEKVDFVFIDADHEYESVYNDIMAWGEIVKDGGWIGGHDYGWETVKRAVESVFYHYDVIKQESWLVKL